MFAVHGYLIFTIWFDTPAEQPLPHPAEPNKMFVNDGTLKYLSKKTNPI
jgi:hypothetical protein